MKNTNESKTWKFDFDNGVIRFEFAQSVDIRKAFEAMKATTDDESWMDKLNGIESNVDTFEMDCEMYGDESSEGFTSIVKAVAEVFSAVPFVGSLSFSSDYNYCDIDLEFSYSDKQLHVTETFAGDDNGYFCPECGFQVGPVGTVFEEDEITCDDCDEVIKISDLVFVPATVTKSEYVIGKCN